MTKRLARRFGDRIGERLALAALGLILAGATLEASVLLLVGEVPKFPRHVVRAPWGLRYNQPSTAYRHKSADGVWYFRINAQGMRSDREYAYEKPTGIKRIISLGDSFTLGFEVNVEETFSAVMEQQLINRGHRVEVLNAGVSGFSSAEALLYLKRELRRYEPDLVLITFWFNDHRDNVRSDLFRLVDDTLVPWNEEYVPLGTLGDALNRNWLTGVLSEWSNGFVFVKQSIGGIIKSGLLRRNATRAAVAAEPSVGRDDSSIGVRDESRQLTAAIYEELYTQTRALNVPLVIQSIPTPYGGRHETLIDQFPLDLFDVRRHGITYVSAKQWLAEYADTTLLFWRRSQSHWTPFSHRQAGSALAELISLEGLLH